MTTDSTALHSSHPLASKPISNQLFHWPQLLEAWDTASTLVEHLYLLDRYFGNINPIHEKGGESVPLMWLLEMADQWSNREFFTRESHEPYDSGYNQEAISVRAMSIAVNRFLYPASKINWTILQHPYVFEKLAWFFRPTKTGLIPNLFGGAKCLIGKNELGNAVSLWPVDEIAQAANRLREYAGALWKASWELTSRDEYKGWGAPDPRRHLPAHIAARPSLLHLALVFRELHLLTTAKYWPDEACKQVLREWVCQAQADGSNSQATMSLVQAALRGSEAAKVLLVVEPIDEERAKEAALLTAEAELARAKRVLQQPQLSLVPAK